MALATSKNIYWDKTDSDGFPSLERYPSPRAISPARAVAWADLFGWIVTARFGGGPGGSPCKAGNRAPSHCMEDESQPEGWWPRPSLQSVVMAKPSAQNDQRDRK